MSAPAEGFCIVCGRPERQHSGHERFCGMYATFRTTPHPPIHDEPRPVLFGWSLPSEDTKPT